MFLITRAKESKRLQALRQAIESLENRVLLAYTLDPAFDGDGTAFGAGGGSFVVQSDNKIVAPVNGGHALRRYNTDGSVDQTFNGANNGTVTPFAVGQIKLSGGKFIISDGASQVARLNSNGTLDTTFGGGDGIAVVPFDIASLMIAPDGKIDLAGTAYVPSDFDPDWQYVYLDVARLNSDGSPDTSFATNGLYEVNADARYGGMIDADVQSDGKIIYLYGTTFSVMDGTDYGAVRLNADGTWDNTFHAWFADSYVSPSPGPVAVAAAPDGSYFMVNGGRVEHFNADGTRDTGYNVDGLGLSTEYGYSSGNWIYGITPLADGKALVTGFIDGSTFSSDPGPNSKAFVARLLPNGNPDTIFSGTPNGMIIVNQQPGTSAFASAVDSFNRVFVGGSTPAGDLEPNLWTARLINSSVAGQQPYRSTPFGVGQTIQAEDYDSGGEGVAYHDTDAANVGGVYRTTEGVDVEITSDTGGGYDVGYTAQGEWIEYTIAVPSGSYSIDTRLASALAGGVFHYEIDGRDVSGPISVPNTGGWQNWTTLYTNLGTLTGGTHTLRLVFDPNSNTGGQGNINWMRLNSGATLIGNGLRGEYYNNMDFTALGIVRNDAKVDFNWGNGAPDPAIGVDTFSVRWTGQLRAPTTGTYTFYTTTDDGGRLTVNGKTIIDHLSPQPATEWSGSIDLVAGNSYDIKMEYFDRYNGALAKLQWSGPGIAKQVVPTSVLFSPSNTGDFEPPSAMKNIRASSTDTTITVTWDAATDNVGIAGYEIQLYPQTNWIKLGPDARSYTFTNLQPNTPYSMNLRAFDAAGNRGSMSGLGTATTNSNADTQPPSAVPNFHVVNTTDTTGTLAWSAASDNVAVAGYQILVDSGNWISLGANARSYTFSNQAPSSTHYVDLRAFDQAGNVGPLTQTSYTTQPASTTGAGLKGEYFNNSDFTAPVLTRTDSNVNFNWGTGSPAAGIDPDTFSVRWTGKITVPTTGRYTFYTTTDDGVRLWVNGQLLVDKLVPQAATEWSGSIDLVAGQQYDFRMDYFDRSGGAQAKFSWSGPGISKQIVPASAFSAGSSGGDTQAPSSVPNFRATSVQTNSASVAWDAATDNVGVANYEIWKDNNPPVFLGSTDRSFTFNNLQPSTTYTLNVRAMDMAGNRGATSSVVVTTSAASSGGGLAGTYSNNMDFTDPVFSRFDPTINFNWGAGSPDPRIDADTFSVRWSGRITVPTTGRYTFYTTSDDGARLTINGQRIIDKLVPQSTTTWSGSIDLVAGQQYTIVLDYFDRAGGASAKLEWAGPGISRQVVPESALTPDPILL